MSGGPGIGQEAPGFTLPDQHGVATSLSADRGAVLIVFFPAAFTPVCHDELRQLRDVAATLPVLAISCDSMYVLRTLADIEHLDFSLLSDFWPHGDVARSYGAFNGVTGLAERASFLVDATGVVRGMWRSSPDRARDTADYLRLWEALGDTPDEVA
ncbi:MAG: redoxin domain-containing protein [Candidatus Nanopelagicales bacterium]|nr:redoxin domain-containing protein [Candidatus Nanopelagicales bacterium]MDP4714589.1 redoxin domain-containing protein [Candidatus Nanopelagicales bacterium]MDP4905714.1 redoxin domain-containing protein [Candidatus Nanopelagicales bacterium]MDP5096013.1 redoxin domain-containing protein [Candidatus Nanopelagicales bacterium]